MILFKSAGLQETHLPRFFLKVLRLPDTKFLDAYLEREVIPVLLCLLQTSGDHRIADTLISKIGANPRRTFALVYARADEGLGEALVTLQPVVDKLRHSIMRNVSVESERCQLSGKF